MECLFLSIFEGVIAFSQDSIDMTYACQWQRDGEESGNNPQTFLYISDVFFVYLLP